MSRVRAVTAMHCDTNRQHPLEQVLIGHQLAQLQEEVQATDIIVPTEHKRLPMAHSAAQYQRHNASNRGRQAMIS